ncbi:MAG TPA: CAP domain-containing protein, partial [Burkholderiaceae bacterium]|nr:CAP domain-containing protein [Burkholderiaceae bacterium]
MRPAALPCRSIRGAAVVGVVLALCAPCSTWADFAGEVTRKLQQRSNELRAASGWKPLASEPRLTAAAARFAQYMAETDRYGHEVDGRQPAERAKAQGYDHCLTAENIA